MDYNKIKKVIKERNIPVTVFIKKVVKMSPTGFNQALDNKTLTISKLEEISEYLKLPINYWWDDEPTTVDEPYIYYDNNLLAEIRRLKKQIDDLIDDKQKLKVELKRIKRLHSNRDHTQE